MEIMKNEIFFLTLFWFFFKTNWLILELIFGTTSMKNTALNAINGIHMGRKWNERCTGAIDISSIKTTGSIKSGRKFLLTLRILKIVNPIIGIIMIKNEW